uniref:Uncharacterized protein n=1 Tax=Cucumis melo TaxID=3656 RepID=A0A9I9ELN3_CUCME
MTRLLKRPWLGTQAEGLQNGECKQFVDILFAVHRKRD